MKVLFKLKDDASDEERAHVLEFLDERGADNVRPLFPRERDAELASIFVAELPGGGKSIRLLKTLNSLNAVQYAEEEPTRKLIS